MTEKIVTLTMNPSIDVSTSVGEVKPIHKMRCAAGHRDPGGGGINVARVVQRFGLPLTAVYVVGGISGKLLQRLVTDAGIDSCVIETPDETREDFTVYEEKSGNQFRFVMPGPDLPETVWKAALEAVTAFDPAPGFIVASGSLPHGVPTDFYARAVEAGRKAGAKVVIDTSGVALAEALAGRPFMIKPSLRELRELTGMELKDEPAMIEAARAFVAEGKAEMVALTLGEDGALLVTGEGVWRANAPKVKVLSAVGAGDSFVGAMVCALSERMPIEEAFRRGVAAGSAALLAAGTELCQPKDVERLLPQVKALRLA